jgi:class 3 adenylate cyclase
MLDVAQALRRARAGWVVVRLPGFNPIMGPWMTDAQSVRLPEVSYARSGDVAIAYQVVGSGPLDIVFVRGMVGDLLSTWEQPLLVRLVRGLAECGRVLLLDKRGTGLSDRVRHVQSIESSMDDIRAVMDSAGSSSAVVWTGSTSTGIAALFAATYPDRCSGWVLFDPWVRGTRTAEYPWAPTAEEWRERLEAVRSGWGERRFLEALAREWAPPVADNDEFVDWFVWHMRRSLSPGAALTSFRTAMELDVSDVLPAVRVPTVVLPRPSLPGPGHYTAQRIPNAEVAELPGFEGIYTWVDDDALAAHLQATEKFISRLHKRATASERVLATILFTDIVGSTQHAARLGDEPWRDLLARHHAVVRRALARYHGRELDTAGDGFFAAFDGPARAVQAAAAIRDEVRPLGIEIRAGLHTGECAVSDGKLAGIAVATGARISSVAEPGEVLVSSTVKDLVAGSGLRFEDRGERQLKGVPGEWHLYKAVSTDPEPRAP